MRNFIKGFLKKILPLPANSMNNKLVLLMEAIREEAKRSQENTYKASQENRRLMGEVLQKLEILQRENARILADLTALSDSVVDEKICWNNPGEKKMVNNAYGEITTSLGFKDRFLRLIKGLDAESILTVSNILKRQHVYLNTDEVSLDLFSRKEQKQIRLVREHLEAEIFKVSDDLYCYRNYLLPINHFEPSVFYYKCGIDYLQTLKNVRNKDIIDAGAFIGDSALILSPLTDKKVYCFEAVPKHFELMKKTVELNDLQNVIMENLALYSEKTELPIYIYGGASGNHQRPEVNYQGTIVAQAITLDEYVAEHQLDIGLIKVDIEGTEQAFLQGAKQTIVDKRPILIISIYHSANDLLDIKPMIESWNLGYKFRIFKPVFENASSETLLLAEIPECN